LYSIFIEKGYTLLKTKANFSFIIPNSILMNSSYLEIRKLIVNDIDEIIKLPDNIFDEATVETIIFRLVKDNVSNYCKIIKYGSKEKISSIDLSKTEQTNREVWKSFEDLKFNVYANEKAFNILNKLNTKFKISDYADFTLGITPYDKYRGHSQELIKTKSFIVVLKSLKNINL